MINGFAFTAQSSPLASTATLLAQEGDFPWQFLLLAVGAIIAVLLGIVFLIVLATYGKLWIQAWTSGAQIKMFDLVGMGFRKVRPNVIVNAKIMAKQAQLDISKKHGISTQRLEAHYLAGGDVMRVIRAIIAAQRARIDLDFDRAAAIDLAGRDVMDAVTTSVDPKVIDCPDPQRSGKNFLSAIAKNGVELKIRARVTVRTNLEQLIGGATEDTVIARVGESIISSIGSSLDHKAVLENPDRISKAVLERGLDAQTAFEIVSIDIADIDVGENIGARLQADQAEADTRVARANAEKRRADAIAREQEMKADVAKQKANLVLAESEVPIAMAGAFRDGNLRTK
ncbi:SigmaW regulon antibacterial [Mariniblastus fucicola]|uniref:Flotillin-like protein FloA n=1 Tax=Mariniblastus fucicola TaxID=980251 RepID=A0A5B9P6B0_9BACT|nr:SigmaW regulon antibacterial [Mariniblastus fucicola]